MVLDDGPCTDSKTDMKLIGALEKLLAGALFAALSGAAFAHHASVEYDRSILHEIEGELISVRWRNPHIAFEVATTNEGGNEVVWDFEALAVSALNRRGGSRLERSRG